MKQYILLIHLLVVMLCSPIFVYSEEDLTPQVTLYLMDEATKDPVKHFTLITRWYTQWELEEYINDKKGTEALTTPYCLYNSVPGHYQLYILSTDKNGNPTGKYGYHSFEISEENTDAKVTIPLSKDNGISVSGTAFIADGFGLIPEGKVILRKGRTREFRNLDHPLITRTMDLDESGKFTFNNLFPDTYYLSVDVDGYQLKSEASFKVFAGKEVEEQSLMLYRSSQITGQINGPEGADLSGIELSLSTTDKKAYKIYTKTDAEGKFIFDKAPSGKVKIQPVNGVARSLLKKTYELAPGETSNISIDLSGTVQLEGEIILDGTPWHFDTWVYGPDKLIVRKGALAEEMNQKLLVKPQGYQLFSLDPVKYGMCPMTTIESPGVEPLKIDLQPIEVDVEYTVDEAINGLDILPVYYTVKSGEKIFQGGNAHIRKGALKFYTFMPGEYEFTYHAPTKRNETTQFPKQVLYKTEPVLIDETTRAISLDFILQ